MPVALDRALPAADAGGMADGKADPDPEVPERARRRTFTAKYKLEILAAYDAAEPGEKGAILRREGLYFSHHDEPGERRPHDNLPAGSVNASQRCLKQVDRFRRLR